jgi:ribosomal protein S18 acetylase RimI-like enzyme
MIRAYKEKDLSELLDVVFKDNLVGRKFYEKYGFIMVAEHVHEETGFIQLRLRLCYDLEAVELK